MAMLRRVAAVLGLVRVLLQVVLRYVPARYRLAAGVAVALLGAFLLGLVVGGAASSPASAPSREFVYPATCRNAKLSTSSWELSLSLLTTPATATHSKEHWNDTSVASCDLSGAGQLPQVPVNRMHQSVGSLSFSGAGLRMSICSTPIESNGTKRLRDGQMRSLNAAFAMRTTDQTCCEQVPSSRS